MEIPVYLTIGYANADHEDVLDVPDNATDDEINQMIEDWAFNYIEFGRKD